MVENKLNGKATVGFGAIVAAIVVMGAVIAAWNNLGYVRPVLAGELEETVQQLQRAIRANTVAVANIQINTLQAQITERQERISELQRAGEDVPSYLRRDLVMLQEQIGFLRDQIRRAQAVGN